MTNIVLLAARAHYEAFAKANESPLGGFSRWATWEEACKAEGFLAERLAAMRAAIGAMREPTKEMEAAGALTVDFWESGSSEEVWRAMIDAALAPYEAEGTK